ncbi:MAG: hypothetical protein ACRYFY_02495, partial [Janthinobacterium lividum]
IPVPTVSFRIGDHSSFGRLVVLLPTGLSCVPSRDGDVETLRFEQAVKLVGPSKGGGAAILSVVAGVDELTVRLRPSATVHTMRIGQRLVVDVFPQAKVAARAVAPTDKIVVATKVVPAIAAALLPGLPSPLIAVVEQPLVTISNSKPAVKPVPPAASPAPAPAPVPVPASQSARPVLGPAAPILAGVGPVSIAASIVSADKDGPGGLLLPFDGHVGAAAYRRGDAVFVVLDSTKPVDLSAVTGDPAFGRALYTLLPSGAVLAMKLDAGVQPGLRRTPDGWVVTIQGPVAGGATIVPRIDDGAVQLPVLEPGHVVTVPDPAAGVDLLVGTTRHDGQNLAPSRHGVGYVLVPTFLGVAVERLSDQLELRATSRGFVLGAPHGLEPLQQGLTRAAGSFSRSLDLPGVDAAELQRRYKTALASAASLPAADRRARRLDAAEAALALDRGREAGIIASVADQDAPSGPDQTRSRFLQAAAAVLTDDPAATERLADTRIDNSDEVVLWRAIDLARTHPDSADAAHAIAARLPLVQAYPQRLRRHLLGAAALALVSGGDDHEAGLVDALDGNGQVGLAKAMLAKRLGHDAPALAAFDRLVGDDDPSVAERAAEQAIGLRLDTHLLDPRHAADRLEARVLDARMAGDELAVRLRVADLRALQQDWPAALKELRLVAHDFPDAARDVASRVATIMTKAAQQNAVPPVDAATATTAGPVAQVTLLETSLDLLPPGDDSATLSIALAARLSELDLPDRAAALLRKAMAATPRGPGLAKLGLELARLDLDQDNGAGAATALDDSAVADLPADLVAARSFMRARAAAAGGNVEAALAQLAPLHGADVEDLRAREQAAKQDWTGQQASIAALAALRLPASGLLDSAGEDLVLRLASATLRAGDQAGVDRLGLAWSQRFSDPAKLRMLGLFTSQKVATVADLPRSALELTSARAAFPTAGVQPSKGGS